jgi:hypothetical protein
MAHDADNLTEVPPTAYRHGDRLTRARVWLLAVAILAAAGFAASEFAGRGELRYTPGSLAAVHATWDRQCAKCHVDARPLGGENWLAAVAGRTHTADDQCRTCHAAPDHHARAAPDDVPGCASCHHEHQGRQAALTRMADSRCTRCHGDLEHHYRDGTAPGQERVYPVASRFNRHDHPPFGAGADVKDPGTVAFNHQLHLSAGIAKVPDPAIPFTLASMPAAFRQQYRRWATANGSIHLDCAACHETRSDGTYMEPIRYERHCQACHPLTVNRDVAIRHRVQPGELTQIIRGYYTGQFLKGKLGIDPGFLNYPLPGKNPLRPNDKHTALTLIDKHVAGDAAILLGPSTCQKCHPSLARDRSRVSPADIPQVWFPRAKFDHTAHPTTACRDCHAGATASQSHADVLLPGIETCVQCHASGALGAPLQGGARFDCVECHRYHDGDRRLHDSVRRLPAVR